MAIGGTQLPTKSLRRRLVFAALVGLVMVAGRVSARVDPAPAAPVAPPGYRVVSAEAIDAGIEHSVLRREGPAEEVHVARIAPGQAGRLRTVPAGSALTGPGAGLETTSSLCVRVHCVVGVNGDFTDAQRQPVGAMVSRGELVRSPGIAHAYFEVPIGGTPSAGQQFAWAAEVRLGPALVGIGSVNRPLVDNGPVLYTARWGPSTPFDPGSVEVVLQLPPSAPVALPTGTTATSLVTLRQGGGPIAPGQVVVTARGAAAKLVAGLWETGAIYGPVANVSVTTDGAREAVGGSPQLLKNGQLFFPAGNDSFSLDRHPRTLVGITPSGETLLVTVDGRQPGYSDGLTLIEAGNLLRDMGATEAVNLDGGGSTTFVAGSAMRNRPSDPAGERKVVSALVVVPAGSENDPGFGPTPASAFEPLPAEDPASRPPNLLHDLLPPVQKALQDVEAGLKSHTEALVRSVDELLRATQQTSTPVPQ